ncbi:MAG TPA: hypothetical protein VNK67_12100, partial [Burkholderiales bacterium]|nr:hypothetical protein [Burkholderiales bacterium]
MRPPAGAAVEAGKAGHILRLHAEEPRGRGVLGQDARRAVALLDADDPIGFASAPDEGGAVDPVEGAVK